MYGQLDKMKIVEQIWEKLLQWVNEYEHFV